MVSEGPDSWVVSSTEDWVGSIYLRKYRLNLPLEESQTGSASRPQTLHIHEELQELNIHHSSSSVTA